MTPKDKPLTRREIEALLAAWCEAKEAEKATQGKGD